MLHKVVCLTLPGMAPFEFGVICEVFGIDRSEQGGPQFDFHIVAAEPGPIPMKLGFDIVVHEGLEAAADADLIAVPAYLEQEVHPDILRVVREAEERGAWILSVCSGAFVLAEAGVLNGRRSTTHWMYTDRLAREYPLTEVDPDVLFVEDRKVVTGAGTAAGIDAALHIVRKELGAAATNVIARRMVVPPQRDGGQSQYIEAPVPACESDSLVPVLTWMQQHLDEDITVDALAHRALMSPRTFARRFRAETGTTPLAWLTQQRVQRARELLEATEWSVDTIAHAVGFGNGTTLRHHFARTVQTSPHAYRTAFSTVPR